MDPHKRSATVEMVDQSATVLATGRYSTDTAGYNELLTAAKQFPDRVWAIEGCNGVGRHLAHRLIHDVADSQIAARPARPNGHRPGGRFCGGCRQLRNSSHSDTWLDLDGPARHWPVRRRTAARRCRRRPHGRRQPLPVANTRTCADSSAGTSMAISPFPGDQLHEQPVDWFTSSVRVRPSSSRRSTSNRFASRDRFASWNGTAPLDASSGQQQRHRLSRTGNRKINRVLHVMALVQSSPADAA
ncbi:transposase [Nocardia asiatica]|uniref:transposase n=1 Tax=Nocardia asiatica TaxID=209252 RepID=UPI003EE29D20